MSEEIEQPVDEIKWIDVEIPDGMYKGTKFKVGNFVCEDDSPYLSFDHEFVMVMIDDVLCENIVQAEDHRAGLCSTVSDYISLIVNEALRAKYPPL